MKPRYHIFYGNFTSLILLLIVLPFFSACKKNSNYDFTAVASAKVQLVNASTDAGPSILAVANVIRTGNTVNFNIASGYAQTFTGLQNVDIQQSSSNNVLAATSNQFDASNSYTFFLTGTAGNYGIITVHDDTPVSTTKAKVRFVQASSSIATAVDVVGNGTVLFTAQSFKAVSSYQEVGAGNYFFGVNTAGGLNILATITSVPIQAGGNYTVYTSGIPGITGDNALSIKVLKNN